MRLKNGEITKEEYLKAREEEFCEYSDIEEENNHLKKIERISSHMSL